MTLMLMMEVYYHINLTKLIDYIQFFNFYLAYISTYSWKPFELQTCKIEMNHNSYLFQVYHTNNYQRDYTKFMKILEMSRMLRDTFLLIAYDLVSNYCVIHYQCTCKQNMCFPFHAEIKIFIQNIPLYLI